VPEAAESPEAKHPSRFQRFRNQIDRMWRRRGMRWAACSMLGICIISFAVCSFYYLRLASFVDRRLEAGPFSDTTNIFSASHVIAVGDVLSQDDFTAQLRKNGYTENVQSADGWFKAGNGTVEVTPGPESASGASPVVLEFAGDRVTRITSEEHREVAEYDLGPQLMANLSGRRERRRLVRFSEIPESVVHAVVAVEDKRFFQHWGFDVARILKAAIVDLRSGHKDQGASTLSMQLARSFWLEPSKRWKRKIEELAITLHMEQKLTKQQIFEYYANQVYLGRRDTFSISGFAEGARAYFNKDLSQIDTAEAAFLAGLVQRPSYYNPYRYPERARDRRNVVLTMMRRNGYLSEDEFEAAVSEPLQCATERTDTHQNQYFIDLVNDELRSVIDESDRGGRNIYTTLDPELQAAAEASVRIGMAKVDKLLRARGKFEAGPGQPQVALVALDPRTGEVKALVGGRDYGASQLNHAVSMRQPGSVFKPFVYAAALNTALEGGNAVFTPASVVVDAPRTFFFGNQVYEPSNFHHEFMGEVTLRDALAHSLNVAAVTVASQVGYAKVVRMAQRCGLNHAIRPTPAVALGAYETTPLEIARAYTTFANRGINVEASMISQVRTPDGRLVYQHTPQTHVALDAGVTYLMVSMMQDVLRRGTGAGVRSLGFTLPAAGKTGTSHDGWFAGFTSELLCVVWVGFDDNRELNLEGAHSALPIWAEFMNRASRYRRYRDVKTFTAPDSIVSVEVCADSGLLPGPFCPRVRPEVFLNGTQPQGSCSLHEPVINEDAAVEQVAPTDAATPAVPDHQQ
jgi:penicillin-binding protein 1B